MQQNAIKWAAALLLLFAPMWGGCGLREARIKREKEASAHYKFGIAYLGDKPPQVQQAYIEFQKAVKLDPRYRDAHYALGHVFFQQERYEESIAAFKKALSIDPSYSEAQNYLGRVYSLLGEHDKALAAYQAALKNPQYSTPEKPYWNIGLLYIREKDYPKAVDALKNALRVNPNLVAVHTLLGEVYAKMGDTRKAVSAYRKVIEIRPNDINAHYNLACIYQKAGEAALADAAFDKVIALLPDVAHEEDFRKCLNPIL